MSAHLENGKEAARHERAISALTQRVQQRGNLARRELSERVQTA